MNEQLSKSLEKLQRELGRLAPAVDHISAAEKVTQAVQGIPIQQQLLVESLTKAHEEIVAKSEQELTKHASELRNAVADHQTSLIEQKTKLVDSLTKEHSKQISANTESLNTHATELRAAIASYQSSVIELQNALKKDAFTTHDGVKAETAQVTDMRTRISAHQEAIEKIDFPTRLEKLDATVSGIMAATQTTQGRVDNLERATSEKLTALTSAMEKQQTELMAAIAKANKSTRTLLFVSIVLSVIVLAAIAYLLTRN
jgi:hypothetical protein